MATKRRQEIVNGYLLILPLVIILISLTLYPFFYALVASMRSWNLTSPASNRFIGLSNYLTLLSDERFWNALKNTAIYSISAVGIEFILGFLVAFLLDRGFRGRNIIINKEL